MERIQLRGFLMKESKEKEHRITNLKDMIDNVKGEEESSEFDDIEEDGELIEYLNEDNTDYDELEIDDEFIYHPGDEDADAIDLEENQIDEDFIIKTPKTDDSKEIDDEYDEFSEDLVGEISGNFDSVVHAKIKGRPIFSIVGIILGVIFIGISIFIFQSRSDRVIDNVVAGESSFMFVIFLIVGLFLLIYGIFKLFNIKNPLENITSSIDSIDSDKPKSDENAAEKKEPSQKPIPKSNIPLDKESYKIGEFDADDLKTTLKKPTDSKKDKPVEEDIEDIPPAKEKSPENKGLIAEEIEQRDYEQAKLENESIDDIFAEVEDIEEIPIISIDSKEKK